MELFAKTSRFMMFEISCLKTVRLCVNLKKTFFNSIEELVPSTDCTCLCSLWEDFFPLHPWCCWATEQWHSASRSYNSVLFLASENCSTKHLDKIKYELKPYVNNIWDSQFLKIYKISTWINSPLHWEVSTKTRASSWTTGFCIPQK